MPELATRYPCPVCLGVTMETIRIGTDAPLEVDHCGRCGGVWFDNGEVDRLRKHPSAALWARIARQQAEPVTPCHNCHAPLSREVEKCEACGSKNLIDCPVCDRLMLRQQVPGIGIHVDACRTCRGVWFDHSELDTIWKLQLPGTSVAGQRGRATSADTAGDVALGMLWFAPDLLVHGAIGAAHTAAHLPGAVAGLAGAAPEAAANLAGAAGEAAGGIFESIASIIAGIFEMLDFG